MNNNLQICNLAMSKWWPLKEMVCVWNENIGKSFPINDKLFERNLLGNDWVVLQHSYLAFVDQQLVGFLLSKASLDHSLKNDQKQIKGKVWISALLVDKGWRNLGIGSQLLQCFEEKLTKGTDIAVGTDPCHLFPGVPVEEVAGIKFLERNGYEVSGRAYDLRTNIASYNKKYSLEPHYEVRRMREGEKRVLLSLVRDNFSQRWYEDTVDGLNKGRSMNGTVGLFKAKVLIGFAHVHTYLDEYLAPSVFWKARLQKNYGGLGPIGVAKEHQGKGLGTIFFEQIVLLLQEEGIEDMVVDWTILLNYYGKFGFKPWNEYTHAYKSM